MGLIEMILENVSFKGLLVFLSASYVLYSIFLSLEKRQRLRRLAGAPAPKIKARWPLGKFSRWLSFCGFLFPSWFPPSSNPRAGLDIVKRQVKATMNHKNLESWYTLFQGVPGMTAEGKIIGRRLVFTSDPENIKAILAAQFGDYGKGEPFHREWSEFLGDSIFTTDGDQWHDSRQLIRPQFVKERISDLDCFESHLDTLFRAIANGGALNGADQKVDMEAGNGKPVEISDLFFRYTLDVATDFLLGLDVQSLT